MGYFDALPIFKNFVEVEPIEAIAASDTLIRVDNIDQFPWVILKKDFLPCVIRDAARSVREVVYVTGINEDAGGLIVERGKEGTEARNWPLGTTYVYLAFTAATVQLLRAGGFAPVLDGQANRPEVTVGSANSLSLAGTHSEIEKGMAVRVIGGNGFTVIEPDDEDAGGIFVTNISFADGTTVLTLSNVTLPNNVSGIDIGLTKNTIPAYTPKDVIADDSLVTATGSTAARTLADRFGDVINVLDFGAKGDGTTDDTAAFRRAQAAAQAAGGVVYVPAGTYKVTEDVEGEFISFGHVTITGGGTMPVTDLFRLDGDGLYQDGTGKLAVDIAAIAEELSGGGSGEAEINKNLMLASLGLPVSLNTGESVTWYVNYDSANATDSPTYAKIIASSSMTADDIPKGKTVSSTASDAYKTAYRWGTNANYPFKTISGALTFIRTHYSLSNANSFITVTPRTVTAEADDASYYGAFSAGAYATSGGVLVLQSSVSNKKVKVRRIGTDGAAANFTASNYNAINFEFTMVSYASSTAKITTNISRIVDCRSDIVNFYGCKFIWDDRTATDASGNAPYGGTDATAAGYGDGVAQTRLIHAQNSASIYLYTSAFEIKHTNTLPRADGVPRGNIFYPEISSYIGFAKQDSNTGANSTYTFTGSSYALIVATRQSMVGGIGADIIAPDFSNFSCWRLFNCQNASGFERNGWTANATALHSVAVPAGLTRPSDVFSSGSWYDGYTPYTA